MSGHGQAEADDGVAEAAAEAAQQGDSVSPALALLRRFGGRLGDAIIRFSLTVARQGAWRLAERLAPRPA
ncbi:MAG: DUF5995 family protein, partial [Acidobacteriota bacterium]